MNPVDERARLIVLAEAARAYGHGRKPVAVCPRCGGVFDESDRVEGCGEDDCAVTA